MSVVMRRQDLEPRSFLLTIGRRIQMVNRPYCYDGRSGFHLSDCEFPSHSCTQWPPHDTSHSPWTETCRHCYRPGLTFHHQWNNVSGQPSSSYVLILLSLIIFLQWVCFSVFFLLGIYTLVSFSLWFLPLPLFLDLPCHHLPTTALIVNQILVKRSLLRRWEVSVFSISDPSHINEYA